MKEKTKDIERRKKELVRRIRAARAHQQEISDKVQSLLLQLRAREINSREYHSNLAKFLGGKTVDQWNDYYEDYISHCYLLLDSCDQQIRNIRSSKVRTKMFQSFLVLFILGILSVAVFYGGEIGSNITGFVSQLGEGPVQDYSENVDLTVKEKYSYELKISDLGQLAYLKISGSAEGEGYFKILLQDKIIYSGVVEMDSENKTFISFNSACDETCDLIDSEFHSGFYSLDFETQEVVLNVNSIEYGLVVPEGGEESPELNEAVSENVGDDFEESLSGNESELNDTDSLDEVVSEAKFSLEEFQGKAVVGKEVSWKKIITPETVGFASLQIPENHSSLNVQKIEGDLHKEAAEFTEDDSGVLNLSLDESGVKYEITYNTSAPNLFEENLSRGKKFVVSSEDLVYENVTVFAKIPEFIEIEQGYRMSFYFLDGETEISHPFSSYDRDGDGLYDEIKWISADSSNRTFEFIIEITHAEHLDEGREFVSDIYDEVRALDGNWSEPIPSGHFVRVVFERNLSSVNDITIYPVNISGTPIINVYEVDNETNVLATFDNILDGEYHTIYLTNLTGNQSTFDLQVLGGDLQFDHIVDPNITFNGGPSVAAIDVALTSLDNRTFVFAVANGSNITFIVFDTNGTNLTSRIGAAAAVTGAGSRVSLASINQTAFAIAWFNAAAGVQDTTYSVFTRTGTKLTGPTDLDAAVGTVGDPSIILANETMLEMCFSDQAESDADVNIVHVNTWGAGTESPATGADGTITQGATGQNLIECAPINSTMFFYAFFDDADNDATLVRMTTTGGANAISTTTDIDTYVGDEGQVAITTINSTYVAFAWYITNTTSINLTVRDKDNNVIVTPRRIDANASGGGLNHPRLAMATVRNASEPWNWFVLAWNDRNAGHINASVYNVSGTLKYNYLLATDENTTSPLFEIYGRNDVNNTFTDICDGTYLFAYTNVTGGTTAVTMYINGSVWDGVCDVPLVGDFASPLVTVITPTPFQNISSLPIVFNISANENSTANYTLNGGITNLTMQINSSGTGFNATNSSIADGTYTARFFVRDISGNQNHTVNTTFTVDRTFPLISYGVGTPDDWANSTLTNIYVNVSWTEANFKNITFLLRNDSSVVNSTTFTTATYEINWTGLAFGNYTYNVSIFDQAGNFNSTATRLANLSAAPNFPPNVNFTDPTPANGSTQTANAIYVNVSSSDEGDHYTFVDFDDSLVGWWRFDDLNSTGGIVDLSKYSNNGSNIGTVVINSTGRFGNAGHFDTSNYISIPDAPQYTLSGNGAISIWFNIDAHQWNGLIAKGNTDVNEEHTFSIEITPSDGINCDIGDGVAKNTAGLGTGLTLKQFYHLVCMWNETSVATFLNGVQDNVIARTVTPYNNDAPLALGQWGNANDRLDGALDEVMLFNRSLTPQEILSLYNASANKYSKNFTNLSDGLHSFQGFAVDSLGNKNQTEKRTVTIGEGEANAAPQIISVTSIANVDPTEDSFVDILFNFTAFDSNGAIDLKNTSAFANLSRGTETMRQNSSCIQVNSFATNYANFSCAIQMWYFDAPGSWNVSVYINDSEDVMVSNTTTNFQYNQLQAIKISPNQLSFSGSIGSVNQTSTNDPTTINNTGNYNAANISIRGINLYGQSDSSYFLGVGNFTVDIATGGSPPNECDGPRLFNGTSVNVTGAVLNRGNNSVNDGNTGQEQIYYCVTSVPSGLPSQTYSTSNAGAWKITLLAAAFAARFRRRKKKENAEELLAELNDIADKVESELGSEYSLAYQNGKFVLEKKEIYVPFDVFKQGIGAAEALCKYLKENEGLKFSQIAKLVKRDQRTVALNYRNALKKKKEPLTIKSDFVVPLEIFSDRKFSVLESVVYYLRENGMRNSEIAHVLNKDQRNVWTLYSRASKKKLI